MKATWVVAPLLGALGVGGGLYAFTRPTEVAVGRVVRGAAVRAVYATGTVEATTRVSLKARVAGPVGDLLVRAGDEVCEGQLVARIEAPTFGEAVWRGKAALGAAQVRAALEPRVDALAAQLRGQAVQLERVRRDVRRLEARALADPEAAAALDQARADMATLEDEMAANRTAREDVRAALRGDAARERATVRALAARSRDTELRSPLDGVVLAVHVARGQVVDVNDDLLRVGDPHHLWIEAEVAEADVAGVRLGMAAVVRADAFGGRVLHARVQRIVPEANRARRTFEVDLALADPPQGLRPGMQAEVDIVTARRDGVLLAPADGVRGGHVWLVDARERLQRRRVTLGLRHLGRVEVRSGLREGDRVVVGDGGALTAGRRVRPVHEPPAGAARHTERALIAR